MSNDGPKYKYGISPEFFGFFAREDGLFYVYLLLRPNGEPFYVGKGTGDRIDRHEKEAGRGGASFKCQTICEIWGSGGKVGKEIVFRTDSADEAYQIEARLIAKFRDQIVNVCDQQPFWNGQVYIKPELIRQTTAQREIELHRNLNRALERRLTELRDLKRRRWRADDQDKADAEIQALDKQIDLLISEHEQSSFLEE